MSERRRPTAQQRRDPGAEHSEATRSAAAGASEHGPAAGASEHGPAAGASEHGPAAGASERSSQATWRALARRLVGDAPVAGWRIERAVASSGLRIVFAAEGRRALTVVLRPPGSPGFLMTPALSAMLVGAPADEQERRFVESLAATIAPRAGAIPAAELGEALGRAARSLAPVATGDVAPRPLRPTEAELRLNLACNQACFFCNCDGFAPNVVPARDAALAQVTRLARQGAVRLTITGGEPTIHGALVDVAAAARAAGIPRIAVQTNAVALADGSLGLAPRLAAAGVTELFVSLHSSRPSVSDRITGAPGTHPLTLRGIDAATASGIEVTTNFVVNRLNLDEPPRFVRWLRGRFPALAGRVFSFVSPVGAALRNLPLVPRISEALPPLRAALDDCLAAGERVRVAGVCGLPLCVLGGYEAIADEAENPEGVAIADDRMKPPACARCRHTARCSGVWRRYVDLYGDAEFVPLSS